jgi:hypothetical protein
MNDMLLVDVVHLQCLQAMLVHSFGTGFAQSVSRDGNL